MPRYSYEPRHRAARQPVLSPIAGQLGDRIVHTAPKVVTTGVATAVVGAALSVGAVTTAPAASAASSSSSSSHSSKQGTSERKYKTSSGQRAWSYKQRKRKAAAVAERGSRVIKYARSEKGSPYRYGSDGPSSFDCSGLVKYVYDRVDENLPRTSSQQAGDVKRIAKKWARYGDLVFFHNGGGVYHVGIYAGNGKIWHAPGTGDRVKLEKIWTSNVFYGRVR